MRLRQLLQRKNPYLFRALGSEEASEIVKRLLEDHLSSSDETKFGDAFFEPIARLASAGLVAPTKGVDIAVETADVYKAIAVKSGPNPFNSSQKARQNDEFNELRSRLFKLGKHFDSVLAHAYGRKVSGPTKTAAYRETSGQAFWGEITGDPEFYLKLITLMKEEPLKYKNEFTSEWAAVQNRFTKEFAQEFCLPSGHIDWETLVKLMSARKRSS